MGQSTCRRSAATSWRASAYKFFGPHLGIVYGRLSLLESLRAYKVRPAEDTPPGKWETGTQNHECLAGLVGTLNYLEALGHTQQDGATSQFPQMTGRARALHVAMAALQAYEQTPGARNCSPG